ncbi:MAG: hypothetical protein Q8N08_03705, partial [Methanobacteriaceae archaeon]|nr:hypothetical protein [Methanobacteriaceae archaeon]
MKGSLARDSGYRKRFQKKPNRLVCPGLPLGSSHIFLFWKSYIFPLREIHDNIFSVHDCKINLLIEVVGDGI